jgi:outer membrane receptor protein involved in Fe transport
MRSRVTHTHAALFGMATIVALATGAEAAAERIKFNIRPQPLSAALNEFGAQSGRSVMFTPQLTASKRSSGIVDFVEPAAALTAVLSGTGLTYQLAGDAFLIVQHVAAESSQSQVPAASPSPAGPVDSSSLHEVEEVVVTARKRAESIQDVPAAISVIQGGKLEELSATGLADYAAYVPGLNIDTAGTPGQMRLTLRGMAPITSTTMVGSYIDDAPLGSSAGWARAKDFSLDLFPYEIQQVEVLRGPQGTLYGANTMGGLLKYVTRTPDLHRFEGRVGGETFAVEGASDQGWGARAGASVPLIEGKLAVRGSYYKQHTPGYIDNGVTGKKNENELEQQGARLSALWQVSDDLAIKLSAMQQDIDSANNAVMALDRLSQRPFHGDLSSDHARPEAFEQKLRYYTASLNWDLGWAEFISATSYANTRTRQLSDSTPSVGPLLPLVTTILPQYTNGVVVPPGLSDFILDLKLDKITQEFRLTSPAGDTLEWMLGAFYTDEDSSMHQWVTALDMSGAPIPGLSPMVDAHNPTTYREYALFSNVTYHFSDTFDVTAGLRWARNTQEFKQIADGALVVLSNGVGTVPGESSENVVTYLLSPRWRLNDASMIYGRVATGYRPGGPNTALPGIPRQVDSDSIVSYEAGIKTELLERRASLELAVFYIDWKDIQVGAMHGQWSYLTNGGKAKSQGVEFTTSYSPLDGLRLAFNTAYTQAELKDDIAAQSGVAGDPLPFTPEWSGSFTADYEFPLFSSWTARFGGGYRYVGARNVSFPANPVFIRTPSYEVVDLTAGLTNERWGIRLYAKNLTDERAYVTPGMVLDPDNQPLQIASSILQPRAVGLGFDVKF